MEEGTISKYLEYKKRSQNVNVDMKTKRAIYNEMYKNEGKKETQKGINVLPSQSAISRNEANLPNLSKFQELLHKLKQHGDMNVVQASGDVLSHYENVLQTMGVYKDTAHYNTLSKMIATTFADTKPFPSTIGSTLYGCHMPLKNADVVDAGCTPTCAGALQANTNSPSCGKQIFMAEPNGKDGFNIISTFQPSTISKEAFIYIPRSKDRQFHQPKFDLKTLDFLDKHGVEKIRFIGYDAANLVLSSVNDEFVSLQSLMPKVKQNKIKIRTPKGEGWDIKTIIIVLLFVVIVGLFFFFNRS